MMSSDSTTPVLDEKEKSWLKEVETRMEISISANSSTDYLVAFNVLRWCYAYDGNLDEAVRKLRRHLRIREILRLDRIEEMGEADGVDELAERYAPMTFLGNTGSAEAEFPVFLEQSGRFDLQAMMVKIKTHSFMLNRFRQMERILSQIRDAERVTGRMSGAVLLIDLQGLSFQPNLVGFLSGTYRIFWGTLMESYAFLFRKFVIVNAPTFMNLLWSACSSFIPNEYKQKVHLIISDDFSELHDHVDVRILPKIYEGQSQLEPKPPSPCHVPSIFPPIGLELELLNIPAGKSVVHSFDLNGDDRVRFYLRNEQEFTLNIFFSSTQQSVTSPSVETTEMEESLFAGCERPGLPALDSWTSVVPQSGFYHVVMGNEKAWIMSVQLEFGLFNLQTDGSETRIEPRFQTVG